MRLTIIYRDQSLIGIYYYAVAGKDVRKIFTRVVMKL